MHFSSPPFRYFVCNFFMPATYSAWFVVLCLRQDPPHTLSHTHKQTAQRLPHESSAHVSRVKHTQTHTHIHGQPKGTASLLELVSDTRTSTRSISCRGDNNLCCCWCCFYCLTACRTRSPAAWLLLAFLLMRHDRCSAVTKRPFQLYHLPSAYKLKCRLFSLLPSSCFHFSCLRPRLGQPGSC